MPTGSPSTSAIQQPCRSWAKSESCRSTDGVGGGAAARKRIGRDSVDRPSKTACSGPVSPAACGRRTTRGRESPGRSSTCSPGVPCADVRVIISFSSARRIERSRASGGRLRMRTDADLPSGAEDGGRPTEGRRATLAAMTSTTASRPGPTSQAARREWTAGARAAVPFVIGLAPFGVAVGAAVAASSDPLAAWTGTFLLYGGSAQLAVLQVLGTDGPVWTAILLGVLIQARLLVYSGSL